MPSLEFQQFTCVRNEAPLFHPLNFTASPGEMIQIVGPNGAGKTTFLRAVSGLFDHTEGRYLWDGKPISRMVYERAVSLLYLGHHPGVKGALSAAENLHWYAGLYGADAGQIGAALAEVGLMGYEDTLCQQMSAGQQRRVALARLFITKAQVWVLDEPFTAIDVAGVSRLEAKLQQHAAAGDEFVDLLVRQIEGRGNGVQEPFELGFLHFVEADLQKIRRYRIIWR